MPDACAWLGLRVRIRVRVRVKVKVRIRVRVRVRVRVLMPDACAAQPLDSRAAVAHAPRPRG